ncbi:hypothetical protein PIROE2DRAFT_14424 [Piromyces sp. E2]|nr:hypothetical protein PIROE2DRAFT_14424 [Piromyces sp. E2]|eukprot:OUM59902.1 hypothetical protein PIROE2DRAFT_14424 [Piromyces sp. E2]
MPHIFADGTLYIAPKVSFQVFVTRTYISKFKIFYTTSYSILKNKEQTTYEVLFYEKAKNNTSGLKILINKLDYKI